MNSDKIFSKIKNAMFRNAEEIPDKFKDFAFHTLDVNRSIPFNRYGFLIENDELDMLAELEKYFVFISVFVGDLKTYELLKDSGHPAVLHGWFGNSIFVVVITEVQSKAA